MNRRAFLPLPLAAYRVALPGFRYDFPRDHFDHPEFQTEWWYWTGNLRSNSDRYGFELTFFRHNVIPSQPQSPWDVSDVFLAHLAFTDVPNQRFFHTERVNRSGPGLAGVSFQNRRIWNGNWSVRLEDASQSLRAITPELELNLTLTPAKPHVIHGINGLSQKAPGPGKASHYISFPRLNVQGSARWQGRHLNLTGQSWMDHEFFTNQLGDSQAGWDWFCIQLDHGEELMLYRLRLRDGSGDITSSGTYINRAGQPRHLTSQDFRLTPGPCWTSPQSKACYPTRWRIQVPALDLDLQAQPLVESQELKSARSISPNYWEGAMRYSGSHSGFGYLELTGYDRPFEFTPKR